MFWRIFAAYGTFPAGTNKALILTKKGRPILILYVKAIFYIFEFERDVCTSTGGAICGQCVQTKRWTNQNWQSLKGDIS